MTAPRIVFGFLPSLWARYRGSRPGWGTFLGLFIWGIVHLHASTVVKLGSVTQIHGPQDLDLEGEFVYAINFSANDPVRVVHGVTFLPDRLGIPGAVLVGPQQVSPWQTKPEFGATADANSLEEILQDIRWANTGAGERLRATLAVQRGQEYKLQVLISANGEETRIWDIRVNGLDAVDEITSLGKSPGQSYARGRATLYTYYFTAATDSAVVEMGTLFGATDGGDRNPIWQALTLEKVSIPPSPEDIVVQPTQFFPNQKAAIATIQVVDKRFQATHELSLVPGAGDADNARFSLSGSDLMPAPFDFSGQVPGAKYSIRLRGVDALDPKRLIEKSFEIQLAAPNAPTSVALDASSLSRASVVGSLVGQVRAIDPDVFDRHVFSLVDGVGSDENHWFRIEGALLKLDAPLPQELRMVRLRLKATDRSGLSVESVLVLPLVEPRIRINEILASEVGGLADENQQPQEWIELLNQLDQPLDLTGWSLSDDRNDLKKWRFPSVSVPARGYLLVLADGTGAIVPGSTNLHSNFSLSAAGEWLGLVQPDGRSISSELDFPVQYPGVAYGYGSNGTLGYLTQPTPSSANGEVAVAGQNQVTFSRPHGFCKTPFSLELTATIPGSKIRYTLDGTRPTPNTGVLYAGAFTVEPSTAPITRGVRMVRAIAVNPKATFSPVATQTYLFVDGVNGGSVDGVVGQSRLLTSITKHATYGPLLGDAFRALPVVSVVLNRALSPTEGRGSLELFDPKDAEPGFQIDCGIGATGTTSLGSPKLAMAAKFRPEYGASKLRYPVFARGSMAPGKAATEFKELRLRGHSHDTFFWLGTAENPPVPYGNPPVNRSGDAQLTRNPWMDEMQLLMGQPGKRGRQVHLFLDGSYNGIYHIHEHPDDDFMASYYPGSGDEYHFTGGATTGSDHGAGDTWSNPWGSLKSSLGNYEQAKRWADVTNLCDYMLLSFYAGNDWDWSAQHNWSAAGPKFPDRGGWKFFEQDSDISLQDINADCTDQDAPDGVFSRLMTYPDFRSLFRDRAVLHCYGTGMLTPAKAGGLYDARMNELYTAIVAETARWQPSSSIARLPWDRDQEWTNEWKYLRSVYFPQRTTKLINQLKKHPGWWPADPPELNSPGGTVPAGFAVGLSTRIGQIVYTLDGSDPRLPGGRLNPKARSLTNAIPTLTTNLVVAGPMLLRARVFTGSDWSGLVESYFVPEGTPVASVENLVVSEVHYHPWDQPDTEFIELLNTSPVSIDLSGMRLASAVRFEFPKGVQLASGERIVVVKDLAAFDARYVQTSSPYYRDGLRRYGPWSGSLSNGGESIGLLAANGQRILSFAYGTTQHWPGRPDGRGSSLEIVQEASIPLTEPEKSAWLSDPRHWRSSSEFHGSPGMAGKGPDNRVLINEVLAAPLEGDSDGIELLSRSADPIDLSGWFVSDSPDEYRKYRFPAGSRIEGFGRWVLRGADFDISTNPSCLLPFGLSESGDDVFLVEARADGSLVRFVDRVEFGASRRGLSFGHAPDGTGPFVLLQKTTFGTLNSDPEPGYVAWAAGAFPLNTEARWMLPEADFDEDGVSNYAEYVFATSPLKDGPSPLLILDGGPAEGPTVVYRIRTAAPDLTYRLELSEDAVAWRNAEGEVELLSSVPQPDGATLVTVRMRAMEANGPAGRWVRVRVD